MTVLRADIESALDDLVSNEEGMRFQGLAVVLAKQHWPDFVASERKKDLGADAIGHGKVLACSLTATLEKLRSDATKVKESFCDVHTIVFATPQRVSNAMVEKWREAIQKEFKFDLLVVSREDVITSLMVPANAALCQSHLGLSVVLEASAAELIGKARESSDDAISGWARRLEGKPLMELHAVRIEKDGSDTQEALSLDGMKDALERGKRIVIEAPAGRGKTTMLVQLARRQNSTGNLAFLVDFPGWISSGKELLQFIADSRPFQSRGIKVEILARIYSQASFSILLNGWNEIEEEDSTDGSRALATVERDFPAAGILVATRTHHIAPPLPGAFRVRLLRVDRQERRRYLSERLGYKSQELLSLVEGDDVLDELTQTPLLLAEVASLFEAGETIPKTKMAVLGAAVRLHEQREEHANHLAGAPLSNRAADYLRALAEEMTDNGVVTLSDESGRSVVSTVAEELRKARQISTLPEPSTILNALCAHHILERVTYPIAGVRFEHQQFQEFYAGLMLECRLLQLASNDSAQRIQEFTRQYINDPTWAEPLRMVAQDIGAPNHTDDDKHNVKAGSLLVSQALKCDPVFAGELSYLSGPVVWNQVGPKVTKSLLALYEKGDEAGKEVALAAMLATGSEEFKDIVVPLMVNDDQQVRLKTYRTWGDFHLSTLGPEWEKTVEGWPEEIRAEFVSELIHFGNVALAVMPFALSEKSMRVRVAAISALPWAVSSGTIEDVLHELDDETFEASVTELPTQVITEPVRLRALAAYQKLYAESSDPLRRIGLLLHTLELGAQDVSSELKDELAKCRAEQVKHLSGFTLKPALDIVKVKDSEWVSHWVASQIAEGALWGEHWASYVTVISPELRERLLTPLATEDLKHAHIGGSVSVLGASADPAVVERVFARLCELHKAIAAEPGQRHELEHAITRQLEALFHSFRPNLAIEALLPQLSGEVDETALVVVSHLFGRSGEKTERLSDQLEPKVTQGFLAYLRRSVPTVLKREDFYGGEKADLSWALARVGEPEDVAVLRELINADIERFRRACVTTGRGNPMSYANWHVRAVVFLDPVSADNLLLELVEVPEYESEAAEALAQLLQEVKTDNPFGRQKGYDEIWEARAQTKQPRTHEERRKRYAEVLSGRIQEIFKVAEQAGKFNDYRLKQLTQALAVVNGAGSEELIFKALGVGTRPGWQIVNTLGTLLPQGVLLPTTETLKLFDRVLEEVRPNLYNEQEVGLLISALSILPFINDPATGIAKIRSVIADTKVSGYQLRDLAPALGHCRFGEALTVLRELASSEVQFKSMEDSWVDAVAALGTTQAAQLLLSFVDPSIRGLPFEAKLEREDTVTARLVELASRDEEIERRLLELCSVDLPARKRALLAGVVGAIASEEALVEALNLIDDSVTPAIPYELYRSIESIFIEKRPYGNDSNAYTQASRSANRVRNQLFEMSRNDGRRKKAAATLLGQIQLWRLEYGRPFDEPRSLEVEYESSWPTVPANQLRPDTVAG